MKTDDFGIPRFTNRDLIDMIYTGHIDKCHVVLCDESDDVTITVNPLPNVTLSNFNDVCLNDSDGDGVCDELEIAGCTDSTALNYDSLELIQHLFKANEKLKSARDILLPRLMNQTIEV